MNSINKRYTLYEIPGAGFQVWDDKLNKPLSLYPLSERTAREQVEKFNAQEQEKLERIARLAALDYSNKRGAA